MNDTGNKKHTNPGALELLIMIVGVLSVGLLWGYLTRISANY